MTNLPKIITKRKKRLGRGYGSGKGGHTVGRGQKGQKSRGKINILFEGLKVKKSLLRRIPLMRGKGKFSAKNKPVIVNLGLLNLLPENSIVDLDALVKAKIIDSSVKKFGVKILGKGELKKKVKIKLPISNSAKKKVESIGGEVIN